MKKTRSKSISLTAFAAVLFCAVMVGFGSPPATGAATGGGGLGIPDPPRISDVICISGCTKIREVSIGGTVQVTGENMESVASVAFAGRGKNLRVKPDLKSSTRVEATVPEGAVTGRIRVITSTNTASAPSARPITIGDETFSPSGKLTITDASTSPTRAYQFGLRQPTLNFVINGAKPSIDLRVDIVNAGGDVVRSRFLSDVPTGSNQEVKWNGVVSGGKSAPNGTYRFVVRGNDGTAATISSRLKKQLKRQARASKASDAVGAFSFRMYAFVFPIRGPHVYGDSIGAGRGHQGQDLMADCGKPVVAARAGRVYYNDYQADGAGNYVVINTRGNGGKSNVYMHMLRRSPVKVGSYVRTGQRIGTIGSSGRSTACHLQFEVWSSPGWYQGGTFLNPTPSLQAWDRYS